MLHAALQVPDDPLSSLCWHWLVSQERTSLTGLSHCSNFGSTFTLLENTLGSPLGRCLHSKNTDCEALGCTVALNAGFKSHMNVNHGFCDMKTEFAALVCLQTINSSNNQPAGWFINWWIIMFYGKQLFLSELKIMHLNFLFVASTASYALTTHHRHNTSLCIFRHTWCVVASLGQ